MKFSASVKRLLGKAKSQEAKAYMILGARPGPGLDLLISPVQPMCGMWYVRGLSNAGRAFVHKFYMEQPFNNYILAKMRREAMEWKLTFETEFPAVSMSSKPTEPKYTPYGGDDE